MKQRKKIDWKKKHQKGKKEKKNKYQNNVINLSTEVLERYWRNTFFPSSHFAAAALTKKWRMQSAQS